MEPLRIVPAAEELDDRQAPVAAPRERGQRQRAAEAEPPHRRIHPEMARGEHAVRMPTEALRFLGDEKAAEDALDLRDEDDGGGELPGHDRPHEMLQPLPLCRIDHGVARVISGLEVVEHAGDSGEITRLRGPDGHASSRATNAASCVLACTFAADPSRAVIS
jgi:hypothetical protein